MIYASPLPAVGRSNPAKAGAHSGLVYVNSFMNILLPISWRTLACGRQVRRCSLVAGVMAQVITKSFLEIKE